MPEVIAKLKLQAQGGKATPAPPWGPAIGQHGLNISEIVQKFNDMTKDMGGDVIPVEITVFDDRSYGMELKTPAAVELLKKASGLKKGSGKPNTEKVGSITKAQVLEIAEKKLVDLSARDVEAAAKIIEGTARSMGITVN